MHRNATIDVHLRYDFRKNEADDVSNGINIRSQQCRQNNYLSINIPKVVQCSWLQLTGTVTLHSVWCLTPKLSITPTTTFIY